MSVTPLLPVLVLAVAPRPPPLLRPEALAALTRGAAAAATRHVSRDASQPAVPVVSARWNATVALNFSGAWVGGTGFEELPSVYLSDASAKASLNFAKMKIRVNKAYAPVLANTQLMTEAQAWTITNGVCRPQQAVTRWGCAHAHAVHTEGGISVHVTPAVGVACGALHGTLCIGNSVGRVEARTVQLCMQGETSRMERGTLVSPT